MYLKRLELQGFKSFVDKLTLNFENGITAIVGPNGSGKSNIGDAIRWCLGEQSAKSLRGSKMEDVIFAGTEKRKPLGYAEVTIVFDNTSFLLSSPYPEVSVTRRVYRSGESEYSINKSSCRLKDIHELFMDTGIGRDGYSIIGQGKIDEILSAKSEDRRQIFEEAAGISKYKYRKIEAEKRLAATRENMQRTADIINELEQTLEPLRLQSEKAKRYLDLAHRQKTLEVNIALHTIDSSRLVLDQLKTAHKQSTDNLQQKKSLHQQTETQLDNCYQAIKEGEQRINENTQAFHQRQLDISEKQSRISLFKNNIENTQKDVARLDSEIKLADERMAFLIQQSADDQNQLESLTSKLYQLDIQQQELQRDADCNSTQSNDIHAQISQSNQTLTLLTQNIQSKQSEMAAIHALFENHGQRRSTVLTEIASMKQALCDLANSLAETNQSKLETHNLRNQLAHQAASLEDKINNIKNQIEHQKSNYNDQSYQLNSITERKRLLNEMEKEMAGYNKSVKHTLEHFRNNKAVHGVLGRLITTRPEYLTAIEIALGASAQSIVVDDEETASFAIDYLKSNKGGRCTFLPISAIRPSSLRDYEAISHCKGFIAIASQMAECAPIYRNIVENILGRIVIVDNMANAINISRKFRNQFRIVTTDGQSLNAGGSITGGSIQQTTRLLGRQAELDKLTQTETSIRQKLQLLEDQIDQYTDKLLGLTAQLDQLKDQQGQCNVSIIKLESEISLNNRMSIDKNNALTALLDEQKRIDAFIENSEEQESTIQQQLNQLEEEMTTQQHIVDTLGQEMSRVISQKEETSEKLISIKMQINSVDKDISLCKERLQSQQQERMSLATQQNMKLANKKELLEHLRVLQQDILTLDGEIESSRQQMGQLQDMLDKGRETRDAIDQKTDQLRDQVKVYAAQVMEAQQELVRLEGRISRANSEIETFISRLWDDYEMTYSSAQELKSIDASDIDAAKREATSVRQSIKALGNVNVDAIEEYKAVKTRYEFMQEQQNDMERAKQNIINLIDEMTQVMIERFSDAFKLISQKFDQTFKSLFGGGRAEISIVDPANILTSGIDIDVCPPGKRLQSLMLLSGGERAFTAIALLFAILSIRPTPFCILDEIEAALDEVNVARFAAYVKNYSHKTQFIIVTHRRGTMEAADMLYGVTMQEKGISQLLEMKPSQVTR